MFCCFFLLLAGMDEIHAQNISLNWAKSIGGSDTDYGNDVAVDAAGNVYVTGYYRGTSDFDPGAGVANLTSQLTAANAPSDDIFIAKYSADGSYLWAKSIGGLSNNDQIPKIALDASGNIYIAGKFGATADFDPGAGQALLTASGGYGFFIAKYDSDGNYTWAKGFGGADIANVDGGNFIAVDASGNVYVTGSFLGTVDFDAGAATVNLVSGGTTFDMFMVKYNAAGNYVWAKNVGNASSCFGRGIALDNTGNIYLTGDFTGTVDMDPGAGTADLVSNTGSDVFLAKYTNAGDYIWAKNIVNGTGADAGKFIRLDGSGNIYVAGDFQSTVDFDPGPGTSSVTSNGTTDFFLARYDNTGNYAWANGFGGTLLDRCFGFGISNSGDLFLTGFFRNTVDFDPGTSTASLSSNGSPGDVFVAKYNASGNYLWAGKMGGTGSDIGMGLAFGLSGSIYVTGYYAGTADFDPGTGTFNLSSLAANNDVFLVKLSDGCPSYSTFSQTVCDSLSFNGTIYTATGVYTDTFASAFNCDSIVTINLTVNHSAVNPVMTGSYCDSVTFNNTTYTATGVYTQTYTNATGCDSNLVYDITITGQSSSSELVQAACGQFIFNNTTYTASGIYVVTLTGASGCDSIVTLDLTINEAPVATVIRNGATLTSSSGDSYQWIDCAGKTPVAGATSQQYVPTVSASYAVVLTVNGCTDTSDCIAVEAGTGIHELGSGNEIRLYPNPAKNKIFLQSGKALKNATIRLVNIMGQVLTVQADVKGSLFMVDLASYANGIYFVTVQEGSHSVQMKFVKE